MAKVKAKVKKKRWYNIVAPSNLNSAEIGETLAAEPDELMGRYVNTNLRNITGNIKQQNINLKLRVIAVKDRTAVTEVIGYKFLQTGIKRFVKRRIDRIDESFIVQTKDNKNIRIKPMLLTRFNTNRSVKTAVRAEMKKLLLKTVKTKNFDDFVREVLQNRIQKEISKILNKIYPTRMLIIREFHIVQKGVKVEVPKTEENPEVEVKEKQAEEPKEAEAVTEKTEVKAEPEVKEKEVVVKEEQPKKEVEKEPVKAEESKEAEKTE